MNRKTILVLIAGIIIGLGIAINYDLITVARATIYTESDARPEQYLAPSQPFIDATKKVKDCVVYIYTEQVIKYQTSPWTNDPFEEFFGDDFLHRFFGEPYAPGSRPGQPREREYRQQGLGTGFIIAEDGYIITNAHVVENANEIKVKLHNDKEYTAKIIGQDKKSDIALIKIEEKNLPFARLGNSDHIQVGESIIAIGNPFGLMQTVTSGIVSATGRNRIGIEEYEDFIQTDAPINPGNSGGPLINLNGDVIGVNTAIYSKTGGNMGIGFAIPINMAKKIVSDLVDKGKVVRGYLGVNIQDLNEELAKKFNYEQGIGVLIANVVKDSPADKAGLKNGDIVIRFNDKEVRNANYLRNLVANTFIDGKVPVEILRDGKQMTLYVTISEQPKDFDKIMAGGTVSSEWLGVSVSQLTPDLVQKYGYDGKTTGVIITSVEAGSPAERYGVRVGDIVIEVERTEVTTIADFTELMEKQSANRNVLLTLKRGYSVLYLVVKK